MGFTHVIKGKFNIIIKLIPVKNLMAFSRPFSDSFTTFCFDIKRKKLFLLQIDLKIVSTQVKVKVYLTTTSGFFLLAL
jgi:hypothetical protein